jgi:hypothetical protein
VFNFYSLEVVERIGYDSFTPDSGVLLAKNKNGEGGSCGYNCFTWVIDAHPEDIHLLDFKRPNGEPVVRTVADYRQLNDALFHAGLNSGSQYEWEDTPNRLHFYVIGRGRDARGILTYTVGVRSLEGAGAQRRGVSLAAVPGGCTFKLGNTGEAGSSDIYRLSVETNRPGWLSLANALAAVKAGETQTIPLQGTVTGPGPAILTVKLKAVSESDPSQVATATAACGPR